ncbi:DUF4276 family protein [Candidatus Venteria ishoeyi]|uniref:DUF4276 domain-containing protein n=1 Tax=Candidatus Venteria ishoeyi TaxID=1899563 RepID=A0A1H6F970_9GAMM|nr:DUF4276 family protein [Candidatus Venteria ishoeyi]MDM8547506.1 DUF4276 family protein [Candidatus Venteria ishoeyi]SEH05656.1 Uncharacterised protein [Candidatus Venteria ishoeyi]
MHFEILVEGQTELTTLSILMDKIVGQYNVPHTWKIHKHQGIGRLPGNLVGQPQKNDRTLLHNLPSRLRAYGNRMGDQEIVVLLLDLDDRKDCVAFKNELWLVLDSCEKKPNFLIRIAIEELEAWYFGDQHAIEKAYPDYNKKVLADYIQDAQCGTWEQLAEAIHPGGLKSLQHYGKRSIRILEEKRKWAAKIAPHMNVEKNKSPSFCCFRDGLRRFTLNSH